MDAVFLELLNRSIAAGWLVLAVVALRALLRRAPKNLRCLLWGLVALRLLLPARLKSVFSLIPSAQTLRPETLLSETPTVQTGFAAVDYAVNPVLSESFAPAAGASVNPLQVWTHIGALLWLAGLAALLLYAVVSYLRLRRRVAESVPLRDNIRLSDRIASPFVLGLIRPRIYLPFGLDEETTALVLAHEQGHIARHDHWLKPFGFLLLALCWFHPLAWLAYVLYCRDIELACDEHVLRVWGPKIKKAYSSALLACSEAARPLAACPLAFGESDVKGRVKGVLSYKKPGLWILLAAALAVVVLGLCFLTDPIDRLSRDAGSIQRIEIVDESTGSSLRISDPGDIAQFARALGRLSLRRGGDFYQARYRVTLQPRRGFRESFALGENPVLRKGPVTYALSGAEPLYEQISKLFEKNPVPDVEPWSEFLAALIRAEGEDGGYGGPFTYFGYASSYDAPLLRLPGAESYMTDSGYVFVWDDGSGRLRIKELWYDDIDREALVVRWSPAEAEADPAYGEAGFQYPAYSWSNPTTDWSFDFEGAWVNIHYYCAEQPSWSLIRLQEGMQFVRAESLLNPRQLMSVRMNRLTALELGGYERLGREELAARWGAPLLTLPELPARFQPGEMLYVIGAELEHPRFAGVWTSEDSGEMLFANWRFNPGADKPMQMNAFPGPGGLPDWVSFTAESRGKVSDTDLVLRYYAADPETDPEAVRNFMEHVELAEVESAMTAGYPMISYRVGLHGETGIPHDAAITIPVGMIAPVLPALGLEKIPLSGIGMDIFDAGYLHLFIRDDGQPCLLAKVPTESPVPVEVHSSKETYTLVVSVVPKDSGLNYHLYDEPDPAEVRELSIRLNGRPLTEFTAHAGLFCELYAQCTPGGQVLAAWSSSDENVAKVTVRVDGCCVLETLRPSEEPVVITAVYGEQRAEMTLTVG